MHWQHRSLGFVPIDSSPVNQVLEQGRLAEEAGVNVGWGPLRSYCEQMVRFVATPPAPVIHLPRVPGLFARQHEFRSTSGKVMTAAECDEHLPQA